MPSTPFATSPTSARLPRAARTLFDILARLDTGSLRFTAPDGSVSMFHGQHPGPAADLTLRDWRVATELLRAADVGMAECYRDGRLETSDLRALLRWCAANERPLAGYFYAHPVLTGWLWLKHQLRTNTRRQARRNIQAHYDLSNAFYACWLDPSMTYSSAIFGAPESAADPAQLAAAQDAKYARVLQELAPRPGARILEIGCGWGGFAEYAARTHDVHVTGVTLSPAQLDFARARMKNAGLEHRVSLSLTDYRDIGGEYDHVVSIEMFEAVGERYWETYFRVLQARLRAGGTALLQTITIDAAAFPRYRRGSDFIREFIFPGGMLAPVPRILAAAEHAALVAGTPFRFGLDYARTLAVWNQRVALAAREIRALGFDERFLRLWHFYLAYCEAGFRVGRTDVVQLMLRRA